MNTHKIDWVIWMHIVYPSPLEEFYPFFAEAERILLLDGKAKWCHKVWKIPIQLVCSLQDINNARTKVFYKMQGSSAQYAVHRQDTMLRPISTFFLKKRHILPDL